MTYHAAYQPQRAVRTERWKYIRRFDDSERPVLANCDDSASKELLVEHGWAEQRLATEQLYDLVFDPDEGRNVAAEPANAAVLEELRERLDAGWPSGTIRCSTARWRRPPGAEFNDPSQVSRGRADDDRHGGSHGRPIQVRHRHSSVGGVERFARPPVLERAQAAVEGAQLPQARRLSRAKVVARASSRSEEEAQEDPVADREHPLGLAARAAPP